MIHTTINGIRYPYWNRDVSWDKTFAIQYASGGAECSGTVYDNAVMSFRLQEVDLLVFGGIESVGQQIHSLTKVEMVILLQIVQLLELL